MVQSLLAKLDDDLDLKQYNAETEEKIKWAAVAIFAGKGGFQSLGQSTGCSPMWLILGGTDTVCTRYCPNLRISH
jgi:hypothetical protein